MAKFSIKKIFDSFNFYHSMVGNKMFLLLFLSVIMGLLDSVGITLLFPLFMLVENESTGDVNSNPFLAKLEEFFIYFNVDFTPQKLLYVVISIFVIKAIIKSLDNALRVYLSSGLIMYLRNKIIDNFGEIGYKNFSSFDQGVLISTSSTEVERTSASFIYYTEALLSFITALTYISYLLITDAKASVIIIVLGAIYFAIFKVPTSLVRKYSFKLTAQNARYNSLLIQLIHSFKYLKATSTFKVIDYQLKSVISRVRKLRTRQGIVQGLIKAMQEPFMLLFVVSVFAVQTYYLEVPIAQTLTVLFVFYRCFSYITLYQISFLNFSTQYGGIDAIKSLFANMLKGKEGYKGKIEPAFNKLIQLKDINYAYDEGKYILSNINIEIFKNQTIAIVGSSGSGKSTLVDVITGLLEPVKGEVLIDNISLQDLAISKWRSKIGYITQENIMFSDSVSNNVTLWDKADSLENIKLLDALKQANCENFIFKLPDGLNTYIGDRGVKLSGGQRQRLAIARELYKKPELLILDEATSALDSKAENIIRASIDELKGKITIIIIAHRLSTVKKADNIYVLENGQIVESGNFDVLKVRQNGVFKRMVEYQGLV